MINMENFEKEIQNIKSQIVLSRELEIKGDIDEYNKMYISYNKKICYLGEQKGIEKIARKLISDENYSVRITGAFYLIPFNPTLSLIKLFGCIRSNHLTDKNNAIYIIKEWRKKRLLFPVIEDGNVIYVSPQKYKEKYLLK